jgi:hypothetical protein
MKKERGREREREGELIIKITGNAVMHNFYLIRVEMNCLNCNSWKNWSTQK